MRAVARPDAPTEGYCQTWAGVRIDEGHFGDTDLAGVKFGFMAEIPGKLGRGNWTVALFVDDKASVQATKALTWIMTGRAGGSTGLLKILAGSFLGVRAGADRLRDARARPASSRSRRSSTARSRRCAARTRATSSSATANTGLRRTSSSSRADKSRFRAVRPQLEFRGQVGGNLQARLGQSEEAVTLPHSRGNAKQRPCARSRFRFISSPPAARRWRCSRCSRPSHGDWPLMFLWLGVALVVDGDRRAAGAAAQCRRASAALVGRHARPGGGLHHLRVRAGLCGCRRRADAGRAGAPAAAAIAITGALYFADREMKTPRQLSSAAFRRCGTWSRSICLLLRPAPGHRGGDDRAVCRADIRAGAFRPSVPGAAAARRDRGAAHAVGCAGARRRQAGACARAWISAALCLIAVYFVLVGLLPARSDPK